LLVFGATAPSGPGPSLSRGFIEHTRRRTTVGRTPLDECSVCRRDLYLTTLTQQTDIRASSGIRTHNLSRQAAANLRLRLRPAWQLPACRRLAFLCPTWQRPASSTMASWRAHNMFLLEKSALKFDGSGVGRRSKHDIFQSRYQLRGILSRP